MTHPSKNTRRIHAPRRRSVVFGLAGFGTLAMSPAAWAQFGLKLGGGKSGSGLNLDVGKLFTGAQNLFKDMNLGEEDEIKIGEKLYGKLVDRSGGAYANRKVQAGMDRFAAPLIATSTRTNFNWEITVINDNRVNAWALPGGKLGVNKGLLRYVNDESELAAVLAHEIGHVEKSHGIKQLQTKRFTNTLSDAAKTALATQSKTAGQALVMDQVIDKLEEPIHQMVTTGFSRDKEREADQHILDVFVQTGHDPAKAANLYKVLLEITSKESKKTTSLFASHPDTRERIAAIEARANGMSPRGGPPPKQGFTALKRPFPTRKKFRRRA